MKRFIFTTLMVLVYMSVGCSAVINPAYPEINVKQRLTDISCITGQFDFGNLPLNSTQEITFTIENTGTTFLNLTGVPIVSITGQNASEFSANTNLTSTTVSAGNLTTFSISFSPKNLGYKSATVSIPNNDRNENPYTFAVIGICTPPAPEIHIKQDSEDILCSTGSFDFGTIPINTSTQLISFTIENVGSLDLYLTGNPNKVSISGNDPTMFIIEQNSLISTIPGGSSTSFAISFHPDTQGLKTAKITILNNDSDENPYTFTITGMCTTAPEINIKQGTDNIPNSTGNYDFSEVLVNDSSSEVTFTIENLGTSVLHLSGTPEIIEVTGTDAAMFTINQISTEEYVLPGNSTTFGLTFSPTSKGLKTTTVSIANSDIDENPYTFTVEGTCLTPEINIKQDAVNIANSTGKYYFVGVKVNETTSEIEFTIENLGDGNLILSGSPIVEITGTNASEFSVNTSSTLTTITPSSDTTFKIQCNPVTRGLKTATVSIANTDLDENPYTFTITGFGVIYTEGDVNGDGLPDVIVGACFNDRGGSDSGCAYIFFGKSNWNSSYDASTADVKLIGGDAEDLFGFSVSSAGDVNDDGFEDVIVGAKFDSDGGSRSGCAFIFLGKYNWTSVVDASNADIKLIGDDAFDNFGVSVSGAGDVNDDGYDDVIVGADFDNDGGTWSGCAFLFFGSSNPSSIIDASNADVKLIGEDAGDFFGNSVSTAGDVNDDGFDDVIVGAHLDDDGGNSSGCTFIYFGGSNISSVIDASNANVKLIGEDAGDCFGRSVSDAGDVNDDGYDDVIVGAEGDDDGGDRSGSAFIFFGSSNLSSVIDASNADVKLIGEDAEDYLGWSVSNAGDVNHDGYDDVVVGARYDDDGGDRSGCVFIFFGSSNPSSIIDASNANVKLIGGDDSDEFSICVSNAGDVNGDGYDDVIIGAFKDDDGGSDSGCAFIFFGSSNPSSVIDASNANVKLIGENAGDYFGFSVAGN